jgi:hypothetical protein
LNSITAVEIQIIGVRDRTTLIIWDRRIISKHNFLNSVQTKATEMVQRIQEFKDLFENFLSKASHIFGIQKGKLYDLDEYNSLIAH